MIHLKNEKCHTMDIVLEGKVAVQKIEEDGNILTIHVFSGGEIIGANLLFSSRNYYPMTVTSESRTVLMRLSKELVLEFMQADVNFLMGLMREISDKALLLTDRIDAISLKTIRKKITDYLKYEYSIQKNPILKMSISKTDLAERFGIQRTSLSRELNKMRKEGLLEYDARTITLRKIIKNF
jgi:CRP-like cAMP-binding protein